MNYIGSKFSILKYIDDTVNDFVKPKDNMIFCDIFSGTSSVGKYFKKKGYNIISNDLQYYAYITAKHFIENNDKIEFLKLKERQIEPFEFLNNLEGVNGFIYNNYSKEGTKGNLFERQYFSDENAKKIDAIRINIEEWYTKKLINNTEYCYLLTCLLEAADKVANTASVYEAFLKKLKPSANKNIELAPLEIVTNENINLLKAYNKDANELIKEISGDILYMDPPYNTRKYNTNYHMLETIALYDSPEIKGKTGVRVETQKKSKYCLKKEAAGALEDLIKNAKFRYLFLSYNDEGIIPLDEIERIFSKYGKYKRYEKQHKRYKSDNKRKYLKDSTIEYIHCLEKFDN